MLVTAAGGGAGGVWSWLVGRLQKEGGRLTVEPPFVVDPVEF